MVLVLLSLKCVIRNNKLGHFLYNDLDGGLPNGQTLINYNIVKVLHIFAKGKTLPIPWKFGFFSSTCNHNNIIHICITKSS